MVQALIKIISRAHAVCGVLGEVASIKQGLIAPVG
jgi:hypothetical protein